MGAAARTIAAISVGLLWGWLGTATLSQFVHIYYEEYAALAALMLQLFAIARFGQRRQWRRKTTAITLGLSIVPFLCSFVAYQIWVGMRGFAA